MLRLTVLLLCLQIGNCLALGSYAQQKTFTFRLENRTLAEVLREIEKQSEYVFFYADRDIDLNRRVSIEVKGQTIDRLLEELFRKSNNVWQLNDRQVIIRKAGQKTAPVRVGGVVKDKKGHTLPGVTILIKGTMVGVVTDADGNYSIELPDAKDVRLIFSFIGMKAQEVAYTGQKEINITMHEESTQMEEVVITGYQTIDRRKNTSAVTSVKAEDVMIPGVSSIDQMLQGRIPDLMYMSNSGEVGVVPKIRIRGTSTLIGNREPLWVIDGIVMQDPVDIPTSDLNDPDYVNRIGNAIAGINPQDIDRIDVLKDAAATTLYGTKAANGVIVITTKKGRIGRPTVQYNMTTTMRLRPSYNDRSVNVMNSKERIQFSRDLVAEHYQFPEDMSMVGYEGLLNRLYNHELTDEQFQKEVGRLETLNTDWFDLLTKNSFSHQHTVSISGGSSEASYYASIGYTRDNDVIWDDNNERYTAALRLDANLAYWLRASLNLNGNMSSRNYYQQELAPMDYAYKTTRTLPVYDEEGDYYYFRRRVSNNLFCNYNILNELENSSYEQRGSGLSLTANLQFQMTDWLSGNAVVSYQNSHTIMEGWWGEKTYHVASLRGADYGESVPKFSVLPFGGELSHSESTNDAYTVRVQINANKGFGEARQHVVSGSAGFEMTSTRGRSYRRTDRGYFKDRGMSFVGDISVDDYPDYAAWVVANLPSIGDSRNNAMSGYASVSYSYYNYFTLNANARIDGSNAFGDRSNDKLLPIWSASAMWDLSELPGINNADWLDFLRVKGSFGYQGNMLSDQSPVMIIKKGSFNGYLGENTSTVERYPNPNLRWEKTTSFNLGAEFALFKNKLMVDASYWWKHTKDAFLDRNIASMNGVPGNTYKVNSGNIDNSGYNISLTLLPLQTKDWFWSISTGISKTFNKMQSNPDVDQYELGNFLNGSALVKGQPIGTFYSYKFMGLSPVDGGPMFDDYTDNHESLRGLSKYDTYTRVLAVSGRREPTMSGSVNTTLRWKFLRMNATLAYSLGNKVRLFAMYSAAADETMNANEIRAENNVSKDYLKRWRRPGDELHTDIPAVIGNGHDSYQRYNSHWSKIGSNSDIQPIANSAWEMYDYSNHRIVSGNYLKCSNLSLTYEFQDEILKKMRLSRLELTLSGTNLFTVASKKLNGQTPTQSGFSTIQLSDRPTYSFGLTVAF